MRKLLTLVMGILFLTATGLVLAEDAAKLENDRDKA